MFPFIYIAFKSFSLNVPDVENPETDSSRYFYIDLPTYIENKQKGNYMFILC